MATCHGTTLLIMDKGNIFSMLGGTGGALYGGHDCVMITNYFGWENIMIVITTALIGAIVGRIVGFIWNFIINKLKNK